MKPTLYFSFAVLCTGLNLFVQYCVIAIQDFFDIGLDFSRYLMISETSLRLSIAIICGTIAGLLVKFILDRNIVFSHKSNNIHTEIRKFTIYSSLGIITTLIFWLVEWSFFKLWSHSASKYLGGALGLSIGYWLKYFLDQRYVFTQSGVDYEI